MGLNYVYRCVGLNTCFSFKEITMKHYTYAHYTKDTSELFYIGKGQGRRARQQDKDTRSRWWHSKIKKHGGFTVEILCYWNTEKEALEHEKLLISIFKNQLVNLTDGGEGCSGYKPTPETVQKIKKALTGVKFSKERCQNISKALSGRKASPELAEKSRKQLEKIREEQKKAVFCKTSGKVYKSITEASKEEKVDASSIVKGCKGILKNPGGKQFCYMENTK